MINESPEIELFMILLINYQFFHVVVSSMFQKLSITSIFKTMEEFGDPGLAKKYLYITEQFHDPNQVTQHFSHCHMLSHTGYNQFKIQMMKII